MNRYDGALDLGMEGKAAEQQNEGKRREMDFMSGDYTSMVILIYQQHVSCFHVILCHEMVPRASLVSSPAVHAEVRLPAVISDHMVVQAGKPVAIWGWADADEESPSSSQVKRRTAKASAKGEWQLKLDPLTPKAESQKLRINDKVIQDVLVGEVWLASGQSNMAMQINGKLHGKVDNADAEVAAAKHPEIRVFVHDAPLAIYELPVPDDELAQDRPGKWRVCSPETVADFSAMGYFFARDLLAEIKQPIGILTSAVGGTPIEAWTSLSAQQAVPDFKPLLDDWTKRLDGFVPEAEQKKFLDAKAAWLKVRSAAIKAKQPAPKAPSPFKNLQVMKPGGLFRQHDRPARALHDARRHLVSGRAQCRRPVHRPVWRAASNADR
jgi:sialate O-acetylesterase